MVILCNDHNSDVGNNYNDDDDDDNYDDDMIYTALNCRHRS